MASNSPSINKLASAVFDNGRRGNPRPGCDCVQCFGYCMVDGDKAHRDSLAKGRFSSYEVTLMSEASGRPLAIEPEANW